MIEELIDDLNGEPAVHTLRIGWENQWREIDLSDKNLAALAEGFDRFWDAARPLPASGTGRTRRRRPTAFRRSASSQRGYDREQFRAWVTANRIKLNRGRPPRDLVDRFL